MTFDTAYRSPPRSATTSINHLPLRIPSPLNTSKSPSPEPADRVATLQRPELKSSSTLPASIPPMDFGHNAWADDDDEFGNEKEIQMTFA